MESQNYLAIDVDFKNACYSIMEFDSNGNTLKSFTYPLKSKDLKNISNESTHKKKKRLNREYHIPKRAIGLIDLQLFSALEEFDRINNNTNYTETYLEAYSPYFKEHDSFEDMPMSYIRQENQRKIGKYFRDNHIVIKYDINTKNANQKMSMLDKIKEKRLAKKQSKWLGVELKTDKDEGYEKYIKFRSKIDKINEIKEFDKAVKKEALNAIYSDFTPAKKEEDYYDTKEFQDAFNYEINKAFIEKPKQTKQIKKVAKKEIIKENKEQIKLNKKSKLESSVEKQLEKANRDIESKSNNIKTTPDDIEKHISVSNFKTKKNQIKPDVDNKIKELSSKLKENEIKHIKDSEIEKQISNIKPTPQNKKININDNVIQKLEDEYLPKNKKSSILDNNLSGEELELARIVKEESRKLEKELKKLKVRGKKEIVENDVKVQEEPNVTEVSNKIKNLSLLLENKTNKPKTTNQISKAISDLNEPSIENKLNIQAEIKRLSKELDSKVKRPKTLSQIEKGISNINTPKRIQYEINDELISKVENEVNPKKEENINFNDKDFETFAMEVKQEKEKLKQDLLKLKARKRRIRRSHTVIQNKELSNIEKQKEQEIPIKDEVKPSTDNTKNETKKKKRVLKGSAAAAASIGILVGVSGLTSNNIKTTAKSSEPVVISRESAVLSKINLITPNGTKEYIESDKSIKRLKKELAKIEGILEDEIKVSVNFVEGEKITYSTGKEDYIQTGSSLGYVKIDKDGNPELVMINDEKEENSEER